MIWKKDPVLRHATNAICSKFADTEFHRYTLLTMAEDYSDTTLGSDLTFANKVPVVIS